MADAAKDQNFVNTLICSGTNGTSIVRVKADPTSHALKVNDGTSGSDNGPENALRDGNNVPVLVAVSETDGVTPVVVYADSNGNILIDST